MSHKHCSDEELLALLDGELSLRLERAVRRHTQMCWQCRTRAAHIEEVVQKMAELAGEAYFPPHKLVAARKRFLDRIGCHRTMPESAGPKPALFLRPVSWRALAAGAACLVAIAGLSLVVTRQGASAAAILREATRVEHSLYPERGMSSLQTFTLEVEQIKPVRKLARARVQITSDPAQERYALRWEEENGKLIRAAWSPGASGQYVLSSPSERLARMPLDSAVQRLEDCGDACLEESGLEDVLFRWLRGHRWEPVSLSADFAVFADRQGTQLNLERQAGPDRTPILVLTAVNRVRGVLVKAVIQVYDRGRRTRLVIRFDAGDRVTEFRLARTRSELISRASLSASSFEPDRLAEVVRPAGPARKQAEMLPTRPGDSAIYGLLLDAYIALHRSGACVREQLAVTTSANGRVTVSGIVESELRKQEILSAFAGLSSVDLTIQTPEEAARHLEARAGVSTAEPVAEIEVDFATAGPDPRIPVHVELLKYLTGSNRPHEAGTGPSLETREAEFANRVLSLSDSAMAHAWALRRLAQDFSPANPQALPAGIPAGVEMLVGEHLNALREQQAALRDLLGAFLMTLPGSGALEEAIRTQAQELSVFSGPGAWPDSVLRCFDEVRHIHDSVYALFAISLRDGAGKSSQPASREDR